MAARLSKAIREQMARTLVRYRFTDQGNELNKRNAALFDRVYDYLHCPKTQKLMKDLLAIHRDAFEMENHICVNAQGARITIGGQLRSRWVTIEEVKIEDRPMLRRINWSSSHAISADDPTDPTLAKEIQDLALDIEKANAEYSDAYTEAYSVLNTFSSAKALAKGWPEAMEVIGHLIPEEDRTLPVVQVAQINKHFKLPPVQKEDKVRASKIKSGNACV